MDIMLSINGVYTLTNVVIANITWVDLVLRAILFYGVDATIEAQTKEGFYRNWFPIDMFIPLAIEVFGCLHQHANGFLHQCANMMWATKGIKGLPLSILHAFYKQKVLVALQHV